MNAQAEENGRSEELYALAKLGWDAERPGERTPEQRQCVNLWLSLPTPPPLSVCVFACC